MACNNCRDFSNNSCPDLTNTNCISFQGVAVPELDVCLNDSLTYVMNIVLAKIKDFLKGKGIVFDNADLTFADCEYLEDLLGVDQKNLINVLNIYKEAICELKEASDLNAANVTAFTNTALYTLGCLPPEDPCGDPYTFKELIQAIITKLCELDTQLESIAEGLLDAIEEGAGNLLLGGAITSCGGNGYSTSGTGASAVITFEALVPPNCPIIFTGSAVGNFDMGGAGLAGTPYCGWFICNGSNGTPTSLSLPQNVGNSIVYIIRFD
jgi:hypothetical protein